MVAILRLLEAGEWAEHCTSSPLGKRLEAAITTVPAVLPPVMARGAMFDRLTELDEEDIDSLDLQVQGYNLCRKDAISLGCQPEKVPKLPEGTGFYSDIYNHGRNTGIAECKKALDEAGVKYE